MKRVFLALTFIAAAFISNAQIRKIPAEVTDAFKAKYPDAQTVSWKDKITSFEASFVSTGGVNTDAYFKSTGDWVETDKSLKFDGLSSGVKDGFAKSKYDADWKVTDVTEIQKPSGTLYRLTIKKSDIQLKYLYFNNDGKLDHEALTL